MIFEGQVYRSKRSGKLLKVVSSDRPSVSPKLFCWVVPADRPNNNPVSILKSNLGPIWDPPVGNPMRVCDYCNLPVGITEQNFFAHFYGNGTWYYTIHPKPYEGREFVTVNGEMTP